MDTPVPSQAPGTAGSLWVAALELVHSAVTQASPWELAGFVTGLACVWLVVVRHIWNFPIGIASCACFIVLFCQQRLFGEAALQLVFIVMNFHGWILWSVRPRENDDAKGIGHVETTEAVVLSIGMVPLTGALWGLLTLLNGSAPLLDAVITALSLVAQWLLNRKRIESWPVWIVVDVLTITLGAWRGLYLLAALYLSYLAMCVAGWLQWRAGVNKRGGENDA